MSKLQSSLLVGFGALVLSTLAIQASDLTRGIEGNLTGLITNSTGVCGSDAVHIMLGSHALCVDRYEASASAECPHTNPESSVQTQSNANVPVCKPQSKAGVMPWRFVSLTQSQQLCARDGKRLPTSEEWYSIVSGSADFSSCTINSGNNAPSLSGTADCSTPAGVYDMVGNVWEWVDEEVVDGTFNGRQLPLSGYVALVDTQGIAVETAQTAHDEFGGDYAWTSETGVQGIIRGGFYGSGDDAGIFAQNLSVPLDFKATGVGFRCVKDV